MSEPQKKLQKSFAEYLELEDKAEFKSEFIHGEILAMSGGTRNHSVIGTNISAELRAVLFDKNCIVSGSDLKVFIESANANVYPDSLVIFGEDQFYPGRKDIIMNPLVVVEVLSDSTAAWDYSGKFRLYEQIPSLKEYVLVQQDSPQIDVYHRNDLGNWVLNRYDGLDAQVYFQSLGIHIASKRIYHRIDFNPPAPPESD